MRRSIGVGLGFVILVVSLATGQDAGVDVPIGAEAWTKTAGEFGVMLLLTDRAEEFFEQWSTAPSTADFEPVLSPTSEATRGEKVVAMVFFSGCTVDNAGNCDTEVDFKVVSPDGSIYARYSGAELWKGKPAPAPERVQVGETRLVLTLEPHDPLGTYLVDAVVRDNLSGTRLSLEQELTVVETPSE